MKKLLPLLIFTFVLVGCSHSGYDTSKDQTRTTPVIETSGVSLDDRMESVMAIIHTMPQDGMNDVHDLFSDLKPVKSIAKDDHENLSMGMSDESWVYSAKYDVTVVVCEMLNTPAHIFRGKSMSDTELADAKEMMKEMMDMMGM